MAEAAMNLKQWFSKMNVSLSAWTAASLFVGFGVIALISSGLIAVYSLRPPDYVVILAATASVIASLSGATVLYVKSTPISIATTGEAPASLTYAIDEDERKHRAQERKYWFLAFIASVLSLTASAASAVFANMQASIADDQAAIARKQLIQTDRPWVKITGLQLRSLAIGDRNINVIASLHLKNVGGSPALNVAVFAKLLPETSVPVEFNEVPALCRNSKKPDDFTENALFAEDEAVEPTHAPSLSMQEVENLSNIESGIPIRSNQDFRLRGSNLSGESRYLRRLVLVTCVRYNVLNDPDDHHTANVFFVSRKVSKPDFVVGTIENSFDLSKKTDFSCSEFEESKSVCDGIKVEERKIVPKAD